MTAGPRGSCRDLAAGQPDSGAAGRLICSASRSTPLPGVAGRRAALLRRLGIETWYDLLSWFPRDFEDWTALVPLADLVDGAEQTFVARVARKPSLSRKGRLSMLRTVLRDDQQRDCRHLVQPAVSGRPAEVRPVVSVSRQSQAIRQGFQRPESGLRETVIRKMPAKTGHPAGLPADRRAEPGRHAPADPDGPAAADRHLPEPLPAWVRREHRLCAVDYAYSRIHQPASWEEAELCRRRLAFEELFLLQSGLFLLRRQRQQNSRRLAAAGPNPAAAERLDGPGAALPFRLTGAQQRVWQEIQRDLDGRAGR